MSPFPMRQELPKLNDVQIGMIASARARIKSGWARPNPSDLLIASLANLIALRDSEITKLRKQAAYRTPKATERKIRKMALRINSLASRLSRYRRRAGLTPMSGMKSVERAGAKAWDGNLDFSRLDKSGT